MLNSGMSAAMLKRPSPPAIAITPVIITRIAIIVTAVGRCLKESLSVVNHFWLIFSNLTMSDKLILLCSKIRSIFVTHNRIVFDVFNALSIFRFIFYDNNSGYMII